MKRYKNLSHDSGVSYYEAGADFICLKFTGSRTVYEYNYRLTGEKEVETMKDLAAKGFGLSTYISQHPDIRNNYKSISQ